MEAWFLVYTHQKEIQMLPFKNIATLHMEEGMGGSIFHDYIIFVCSCWPKILIHLVDVVGLMFLTKKLVKCVSFLLR